MTTGQKLRKLRNEKKLSLTQVANRLNMVYSNIAMIERGERNLTSDTAVLFAEFYGVSVDYLLCQTEDRTPNNNNIDGFQAEILNSTKDLTTEQKQDVIMYINFLKSKGIINK